MVVGVAILGALIGSAVVLPLLSDALDVSSWLPRSPAVNLLGSILVVGAIESFAVYAAVRFSVYGSAEFDERVDGVVYGSAAGVGLAIALNVAFVVESGGTDLGSGDDPDRDDRARPGELRRRHRLLPRAPQVRGPPLWWMPLGVAIAAVLNGLFSFLRGTAVSGGISGPMADLGPWFGLGLAAVLAIGVTAALSALIRRQLRIGLPPPPTSPAPGAA